MNLDKARLILTLVFGIFILSFWNDACAKEPNSLPDELFNLWIHSYEDDTKDIRVFRPKTYKFPRSRGRRGFEIRENGEFIEYRIAPTDALLKLTGRWKSVKKNKINIEFDDIEIKPYTMTIISVDKDMIKVRKGDFLHEKFGLNLSGRKTF